GLLSDRFALLDPNEDRVQVIVFVVECLEPFRTDRREPAELKVLRVAKERTEFLEGHIQLSRISNEVDQLPASVTVSSQRPPKFARKPPTLDFRSDLANELDRVPFNDEKIVTLRHPFEVDAILRPCRGAPDGDRGVA